MAENLFKITVGQFYEMVMLNKNHNLKIKSQETDKIICNIHDLDSLERSKLEKKEIKMFATDWENKVYVIWV